MKNLLLILMTMLPLVANADPVEIDGIYYKLISKVKEAEVTENPKKYSEEIVLPEKITYEGVEYSVTTIGKNAFRNCSNLKSITIQNGVTTIGDCAFNECSGLTSIFIPSSMRTIGAQSFSYCFNLKAVYISDIETWFNIKFSNDQIGASNPIVYAEHLYVNGEEVKEIIVPNTIETIRSFSFSGFKGLTSITISNSVKIIERSAFEGCCNLESVTMPNNLTSIGWNAFRNCSKLKSINIPNSVKDIGYYTFENCSELTTLTIGNGITNIGYNVFNGCSNLKSVIIPNSVVSIEPYSFSGCRSMKSLTLPSNIKSIDREAFSYCEELTDVYCLAQIINNDKLDSNGLYVAENAFLNSYISGINLHVPAASIEVYRSMVPWNGFKTIVALEDDIPTCAKPTINIIDGKIMFSCETEGVEFISELSVAAAKKYYDDCILAPLSFKVSVYAKKQNYYDSENVSIEFNLLENPTRTGDLTGDGKVDVADHVKLSKIIMKQE